jgi:hypothetical protein
MMPNNRRRSKLIAAGYAVNKALIRRIIKDQIVPVTPGLI